MRILSHRGYWKTPEEKNTREAFENSVRHGFGTETDIRDLNGTLVVSHDPPLARDNPPTLDELIGYFQGTGLPLAINVKADGLAVAIKEKLDAAGVPWFAFDMSGPETVRYIAAGVQTYTRHSDIETTPVCYDQCCGVWLDSFSGPEWYDEQTIRTHLAAGKKVCVVSPELHKRSHETVWNFLRRSGLTDHPDLSLCTDFPEEASEFFTGKKQ